MPKKTARPFSISAEPFYYPALFAALTLALLLGSRGIGVSWDEVTYINYSQGLLDWARAGFPLDLESRHAAWNASQYLNPHPPFLKVVNAIFAPAGSALLPFPESFRLGTILWSAANLALLAALWAPLGRLWALCGVLFVLLQPRLFPEFLTGTSDGALALTWLALPTLAWRIRGERAARKRRVLWALLFFLHAAGAGSKLNAFLAILPAFAWFAWHRDKKSVAMCFASCASAVAFVALLYPDSWEAPWRAVHYYFTYPLWRHQVIEVASWYLGQKFRENTLPWHYLFVMLVVATPPFLLLLAPAAWLKPEKKRADPAMRGLLLALLPAVGFWVLSGFTPSVPKHDGARQLTPAFALLAAHAAFGLRAFYHRAPRRLRWLAGAPVLASLIALLSTHPYELSYFNELIGRLPGAVAAGFEPTYSLEAVNRETLSWINENAPPGASVAIVPVWPPLLELYIRRGLLRPDLKVTPPFHEFETDFLITVRRKSLVDDSTFLGLYPNYEAMLQGVPLVKVTKRPALAPSR